MSCDCGNLDTTVVSLQAVRNCTGSYTKGARWMGHGSTIACQFSDDAASLCDASTVSYHSHKYMYVLFVFVCRLPLKWQ